MERLTRKKKLNLFQTVRIYAVDGDPIVFDFYKTVETVHADNLNTVMNQYNGMSVQERTDAMVAELEKLNELLSR